MPVVTAATFIGFVVLALVCVQALGPLFGAVAWLLVYGVFHACARALRRWVDPDSHHSPNA